MHVVMWYVAIDQTRYIYYRLFPCHTRHFDGQIYPEAPSNLGSFVGVRYQQQKSTLAIIPACVAC